jgi:hypothetical protein
MPDSQLSMGTLYTPQRIMLLIVANISRTLRTAKRRRPSPLNSAMSCQRRPKLLKIEILFQSTCQCATDRPWTGQVLPCSAYLSTSTATVLLVLVVLVVLVLVLVVVPQVYSK